MLSFSAARVKNKRFSSIDLLRGIAVLLVICRHWNLWPPLARAGWIGVDLFFVLSGFLISGLLFSETEKSGKPDLARFFIRRGFKIYPLFFLVVILTWLLTNYLGPAPSLRPYLQELLFVQNYLGGIYPHTWSLAVEEHFYILLMLCFALFYMRIAKGFAWVCLLLVLVPLTWRLWYCADGLCDHHFYTHTRADSLFTGVLVAWAWRYRRDWFRFMRGGVRHLVLAACLAVLSVFAVVEPESTFTQGIGFTLIALAFAGVLLYSLTGTQTENTFTRPFAFTGFYSYSIYLVHIPMLQVLGAFGISETNDALNGLNFFLYLGASVGIGVLASELVEQPLLRLRDRILPSRA